MRFLATALITAIVAVALAAPSSAGQASEGSPARLYSAPRVVEGDASYVAPSYGSRYLALPGGPGIRVRICSSAACVTRTSTDAGPDKQRQREGRVADVSYADFARLCGCNPPDLGLVRVTVTGAVGASATLPPTSTEGP